MTAPIIQANYEQLEQVAARFGRATETQHRLMRTVRDHADVLVRGSWEGEGVSAFARELDGEVMPAMQRLAEALREAQRVTGEMSVVIRTAEEEAARLFLWGNHSGNLAGGGTTDNTESSPVPLTEKQIFEVAPYPYALMSKFAYQDNGELPDYLVKQGWSAIISGRTDSGYYGIAYINHRTQQVVIAHRGTDKLVGNDLDDDAMIAIGKAPGQYNDSRNFVAQIYQKLGADGLGHYSVEHTGHSLGAILADLHAADHGDRAITFDNPGSRPILQNLGIQYDADQHISHQSIPNLINKLKEQAGYVVRVAPPYRSLHINPFKQLEKDHSIDGIIQGIDPATGLPYKQGNINMHVLPDNI